MDLLANDRVVSVRIHVLPHVYGFGVVFSNRK